MADDNSITIVKAEPEHLKQIKEIEVECGLSNWSPADYRQEIGRTDSFFRICQINSNIAGFILARLIMDKSIHLEISKEEIKFYNTDHSTTRPEDEPVNEIEIYNIGVRKKYRRMGVGALLFRNLLENSHRYDIKKVWLEVRISNSNAIGFYESRGFKIAGTRKSLYTNPPEDGFIMYLSL